MRRGGERVWRVRGLCGAVTGDAVWAHVPTAARGACGTSGDGRLVVKTLGLEEVRGLVGSYVAPWRRTEQRHCSESDCVYCFNGLLDLLTLITLWQSAAP